jgi:hypothetical protein
VDTIELIGSTMGLGFLAGVRLYATILTLGLAIRFGWFHPEPMAAQLRILAEPMVLIAAGVACAIEFFADKVAWVDSIWDSFHAFIRPIGAVVVSAAVLGSFDPVLKVTLIVLCGGVAFASHSSKAATRLLVNHSPEPFSNIAISLAEDALVPFGVWLSLRHPRIVLALVLTFLVVFLWAAPKVFRAVRLQFVAFMIWLGVGEHARQNGVNEAALAGLKPDVAGAVKVVAQHAAPIVASDAKRVQRALHLEAPASGIRAAATDNIRGLGNSIGYLAIDADQLAFVARRGLRQRVHRIKLADIEQAEWRRGLLMNRLVLRTARGEQAFYVFKDVEIPRIPPIAKCAMDGAPTLQKP